jgi:NAD(P)-dependent dehydrogenase (short-subunit alcohol dehydrogenase family)
VGGGGVLVNISSGAALKGRAGWAPYCAGKAAVDRLTEAVALEEAEVGLRAYAVAPGVVDTAMQERIRSSTEAEFPDVERFRELQRAGAFNTPRFVADRLLDLVETPPPSVVLRLPPEHGQ